MNSQAFDAKQALGDALEEIKAAKQQVIYAASKFETSEKVELLLAQLGALESVRQTVAILEQMLEGDGQV